MREGAPDVEAAPRRLVEDEGRRHVARERDRTHDEHQAPVDLARVGGALRGLYEEVKPDEDERDQVDERADQLRPLVAEGAALVGLAPRHPARDQRDAHRGRVAEVVDGVGQEREAAADDAGDELGNADEEVEDDGEDEADGADVVAVAVRVPSAAVVVTVLGGVGSALVPGHGPAS